MTTLVDSNEEEKTGYASTDDCNSNNNSNNNNNNNTSNVVVAISDYQAAVRAIQETFQEEEAKAKTGSDDDDDDDAEAQELFRAVQASLLQNLSRVVQPTSNDQEYHDIIDPYHIVEEDDAGYDDDDDDDDDEDENDLEEEDSSVESIVPDQEEEEGGDLQEEDQEEEYEEADLLDKKALQDAQRLRIRVRELSRRIQQIRERTVGRTRCVTELTEEAPIQVETPSPTNLGEEFRASVQRLSDLVNNPQWATLPKELQRLQDTIDVVQKEQNRPLSQTDVAIVSRTNSSEEGEDLYGGLLSQNNNDDGEAVSPEDRLAAFFQLVQ